jgi:disulfide oxidoreductase YuzD
MAAKETIKQVIKTKKFAVIVAATVSAVGGAVGGYKYASSKLEKKYADISEKEIHEAKRFYAQKFKDGDYADPVALAEQYSAEEQTKDVLDAIKIIGEQEYVPYNTVPQATEKPDVVIQVTPTTVKSNVFDTHPVADVETFDEAAERAKQDEDEPYIVTRVGYETYQETNGEDEVITLTWYEEDGVLSDDEGRDIRDLNGVVGGERNLRFGYGSNDPNIVFIINPLLDAAYEIKRTPESYSRVVLGLDDRTLSHSDSPPRVLKMRRDN